MINENKSIAVCAVCYNRRDSLARLLASLDAAFYPVPVTLIISIDKSDTTAVEDYADAYTWRHGEKRVVKHKENLGLRSHILSIGDWLEEFDAVVVLEDDVYVAPSFYYYVQECVERFYDDMGIAGISLYRYPYCADTLQPFMPMVTDSDVFLMKRAVSWGQVWMREQWSAFKKWYEVHNEPFGVMPHLPGGVCEWPESSWLKYHIRYCIEEDKSFVVPYTSLSTCFCDLGTHAVKKQTHTQAVLLQGEKRHWNLNPAVTYDGFFEAECLYEHFRACPSGIKREELCIDLYGAKGNRTGRRFWLTRQQLPFKVLRSYALEMKPWELNVLHELEGHEIFLYDTSVGAKPPHEPDNDKNADYYLYATCLDIPSILQKKVIKGLVTLKHAAFGLNEK